MYSMYLTVFSIVALCSCIHATPVPTLITEDPCRLSVTDPLLDICIGLGVLPTTSIGPPTSSRASPSEPLCLNHALDKTLLFSGPRPGPDGVTAQPEEPLLLPGMDHYLRSNREIMHELYNNVETEGFLQVELQLDVLPDISDFTPQRRYQMRQTNIPQLLYDHVSLMAAFVRALDTVRRDQDHLPIRSLSDDSLENSMRGMCHLLYGVHRVLRICDYDLEELQQLHTTPLTDYEPPSSNFYVRVRDLVIVREAFSYVNAAFYDLYELLSVSSATDDSTNSIRSCSSLLSPTGDAPTTLAGFTQDPDPAD